MGGWNARNSTDGKRHRKMTESEASAPDRMRWFTFGQTGGYTYPIYEASIVSVTVIVL